MKAEDGMPSAEAQGHAIPSVYLHDHPCDSSQAVVESSTVPPEPPFLQDNHTQLPQPRALCSKPLSTSVALI